MRFISGFLKYLKRLPIRWKLTLWSALMICVLFLCYNIVQFVVLDHWMQQTERQAVDKTMDDLLEYFHGGHDVGDIQQGKPFVETETDMHEMVRVLDEGGKPVILSTHKLPSEWVVPESVQVRTFVVTKHEGERLLVARAPLVLSSFTGTIEVVRVPEATDHLAELTVVLVLSGAVGAVAISAFGGVLLSRQLLEPVKLLTDTMKKIRGEGLTERVPTSDNGDEFSELSSIFNEMMDRLEASFHQQKQFIEDASHELRTPLAVLNGHVSLLNRWGKHDPAVLDESLTAITQETKRLQELVKELLELTRAESIQSPPSSVTEVQSVIAHVVQNLEVLYPDFEFVRNLPRADSLKLAVRPEHLEQVLFILLDNAIKYSHRTKKVEIAAGRHAQRVWIEVRDHGEGIPAQDLPFVMDRFYRVDKARSRQVGGNGLGLSIAKRLVSAYQGWIQIESTEGEGTKVRLDFPE